MASEKKAITLRVNEKSARRYKSASMEERAKLQTLVDLLLQESQTARDRLRALMNEIGQRARKRGANARIVRSLTSQT